jgi:hypothetical protein
MQTSDCTDPQSDVSASPDSRDEMRESSRAQKILASIIALAVTAGALWFLFGIPAYLLFGVFFD